MWRTSSPPFCLLIEEWFWIGRSGTSHYNEEWHLFFFSLFYQYLPPLLLRLITSLLFLLSLHRVFLSASPLCCSNKDFLPVDGDGWWWAALTWMTEWVCIPELDCSQLTATPTTPPQQLSPSEWWLHIDSSNAPISSLPRLLSISP